MSVHAPLLSAAVSGRSADNLVAAIVAVVALIAAAIWALRRVRSSGGAESERPSGWRIAGFAALFALPVVALAIVLATSGGSSSSGGSTFAADQSPLGSNPYLDPGTALQGAAPDFTLTDQFGHKMSLQSMRGKVVMLAFTDSECTTMCPLTTSALLKAKAMLGAAGRDVELVGVDANPSATAVHYVWSYSELHGMLHSWHFLTGSLPELKRVWKAYNIAVQIQHGQIDHTPALFVISPSGNEAKLFMTQPSYAAVDQSAQLLANEASSLLPGHPAVDSRLSYAEVPSIAPTTATSLPSASGSGSVPLGPGQPRLHLFFATWDREVTDLGTQLEQLNRYQAAATKAGLPRLTAIDEASVESSPNAVRQFLAKLPKPLSYPVAVDQTGRVADGYEVQDEPWLMLTSATGKIIWFWDVSTSGWLSEPELAAKVKAALAKAPAAPAPQQAAAALAGSPAPLAALHRQAGQLLGGESDLATRIRSLHGYPVVVNIWASWCDPCRAEFTLFAKAALTYGKRVAFLGANYNDAPGSARPFLAQHPVSYPSYQASPGQLDALATGGVYNLPETVIVNREGKVVHANIGEYLTQGSLDADIQRYALSG